ncbi:hypothetical protein ACHAWF_013740 [Thalassiosira exigua]
MSLYRIGMMPLCEGERDYVADSLQTWFADDLGAAGMAEYNVKVMACIAENGPRRGYFSQCDKSWYVCKVRGRMRLWLAAPSREGVSRSALLVGTATWVIGLETRRGRRPGWRTRSVCGYVPLNA